MVYNSEGSTAPFTAHGLLASCSVSLPKKSRQGDKPYLNLFVQPDEKSYSAIRTPE